MALVANYEKLEVYQEAHQLVLSLYKTIDNFPKHEKYRIIDQILRCGYSIPANIVEGNSRNTTRDYINFLFIARGSLNELSYFLRLSHDLGYLPKENYERLKTHSDKIGRMLNGLINSMKNRI